MATLDEVRAAAVDLLTRVASPDLEESALFPYGVNKVTVRVKSGDAEVALEIAGPDRAYGAEAIFEEDDEDFEDDEDDE